MREKTGKMFVLQDGPLPNQSKGTEQLLLSPSFAKYIAAF